MSVEIAWKQNILVTDFHLLKSLLVFLGFGSQAFVCGFSRQNINSVIKPLYLVTRPFKNKQVNDSCQLHLGLSITDFATKRLINVKPPLLFFIHDYETILSLISH